MKIGNGDIAKVIRDREGFCFFASGVSNSRETNEHEYQREKDLLAQQDRRLHLVYFSSLRVFSPDESRYTAHKIEMESLVKTFPRYTIVRLGNITWGENPHTLINFMRNQIKNGEKLEIRDEYRYLVDKFEFRYWMDLIPEWSCEMSIVGKRMLVKDIVKEYVLE